MRQTRFAFLFAACAFLVQLSFGQDPLVNVLKMGYTDVAETKRRAEAGDAAAQLSLANTFASNLRPADAIEWYRKAAAQGSIEAVYRMGTILFSGAVGIPQEKSVKADTVAGIELIFKAATNRYTAAYHDMYSAYRDGIGVRKDIVQAHAWLQLDVVSSSGFVTASTKQVELNRLALDVDVATSQAGKQFAALYKAGHWPTLAVLPPPPAAPTPTPAAAPKYALSAPATAKLSISCNGHPELAAIEHRLFPLWREYRQETGLFRPEPQRMS